MYDELMSLTCMYVVILDLNIFYPCLRFAMFFKSRQNKLANSGILRDKTMDNKLMYIPHVMINNITPSVDLNHWLKSMDNTS